MTQQKSMEEGCILCRASVARPDWSTVGGVFVGGRIIFAIRAVIALVFKEFVEVFEHSTKAGLPLAQGMEAIRVGYTSQLGRVSKP